MAQHCVASEPDGIHMITSLNRRRFLALAGTLGLMAAGGTSLLLLPARALAAPRKQSDAIARIGDLAMQSDIATYEWKNRGKAPAGYIKGMAVSYAKLYDGLSKKNPNALEMAKAVTDDASKDALRHYAEIFQQAGMDNDKAGVDTLRHLFVLMLGLGMRESSGKHCEGRDRSADNTTAETAEAGLFQTSWNARRASPLLPKLFGEFTKDPTPSYLEVFKEGVRCKGSSLENYGNGDGLEFQRLSKECPFFAVAFAAVGLRNIRRHWGPINRHDAEVKSEADALFKQVQALVDKDKLGPLL